MNRYSPAEVTARVVALAQAVTDEQHPQRRGQMVVTPDSSLERELALDSLARVELFTRIEQEFGTAPPTDVLSSAETVADIIAAMGVRADETPPVRAVATTTGAIPANEQVVVPVHATTLLAVLDHHAAATPGRRHAVLLGDDAPVNLSYADLRDRANQVAAGLRARGIAAGATVAIMLPTSLEFFYAYFGILRAGAVPVPIYPPARLAQLEEHLRRHATILDNAGAGWLITVQEAQAVARMMAAQTRGGFTAVTVADLRDNGAAGPWPVVAASDLAFIQYTSGSTGDPKGVMLTHANLLANIRAMGLPFAPDAKVDVFVSWLPLYHDMGLIGAWLGSLYFGVPLVLMSPLKFLARPMAWLNAIAEYRGTITAAPNFAYELLRSRLSDERLKGLDLSSLRIAANGAEAVQGATLRGFNERFAPYGLGPHVLRPVYGLAESSVGLAFPPMERIPPVDRIRRGPFQATGAAIPAAADESDVMEFVACGQPLPGHEIRVVDAHGREVPERQEGGIEFRGPSSTQGYFRNPVATAALIDADAVRGPHGLPWLRTGDRGYLWNGDIVVTGRTKDIIIRAGRNLYPAEIETVVGNVAGVRRGCVAVFGVPRAEGGTESLVVMAETRTSGAAERAMIEQAINRATIAAIGEPPDQVVLVPPHTVLKTSSGKIRRAASRQVFERGDHLRRHSTWMQFARLGLPAARQWLTQRLRDVGAFAFAAWWWFALALISLAAWPVVTLNPGVAFNRRWVRGLARAFFAIVGARIATTTAAMPPAGGLVFASNHTSYLDPLVLVAALPPDVAYVAKSTLANSFWTGPFLRHIGTRFVDRFDARRAVEDTTALTADVRNGARVVFFPEGTFTRMPGVLPFRAGAFTVAAEAGAPVVPVAVQGVRSMLRAQNWLPRASQLAVHIGAPIPTADAGWQGMVALRDHTRTQIIALSGEPDLRYESGWVERLRPPG